MKKRHLLAEIIGGVHDMQAQREGKLTLRSFTIERMFAPKVTAQELIDLRDRLHISTAVFARYLRTNPPTVEG